MADSNEPRKETVRITLPPRDASESPPPTPMHETVRINLPTRPPSNVGAPVRPPSPPTSPIPPTAGTPMRPPASTLSAAQASALPTGEPAPAGPKKETARITVLPDPPKPTGSVQMKKTQPLIAAPVAHTPPAAPVVVTSHEPLPEIDEIPMGLCWGLLGVSTLILIIQIWNYLS